MTDADTEAAFETPQVGDVFHEMYSHWVFVVDTWEEQVTVATWSGHPRDPAMLAGHKILKFFTHDEFRKAYAYGTIPGYWVQFNKAGFDVSVFKQLEGTE